MVQTRPVSAAKAPVQEVGRFQVSTASGGPGCTAVFVTVIDTATGEIVRQEQHRHERYAMVE
jgi:hypothetical protein